MRGVLQQKEKLFFHQYTMTAFSHILEPYFQQLRRGETETKAHTQPKSSLVDCLLHYSKQDLSIPSLIKMIPGHWKYVPTSNMPIHKDSSTNFIEAVRKLYSIGGCTSSAGPSITASLFKLMNKPSNACLQHTPVIFSLCWNIYYALATEASFKFLTDKYTAWRWLLILQVHRLIDILPQHIFSGPCTWNEDTMKYPSRIDTLSLLTSTPQAIQLK